MSTPKERLRMIFAGEKPDRPACICPGGMMNMVTEDLMEEIKTYLPEAHTDARKMADLARAVYEKGCFENCGVPFCMTVEAEAMGATVDMGSATVEPHVVDSPLSSALELLFQYIISRFEISGNLHQIFHVLTLNPAISRMLL